VPEYMGSDGGDEATILGDFLADFLNVAGGVFPAPRTQK